MENFFNDTKVERIRYDFCTGMHTPITTGMTVLKRRESLRLLVHPETVTVHSARS